MSNEYGPFDRIVELGVFILIAYEVTIGVIHRRRHNEEQKRLTGYAQSLGVFMDKGQQLLQDVPRPFPMTQTQQEQFWMDWGSAVQSWAHETHNFITAVSPKAAASFLRVINFAVVDPAVYIPDGPSPLTFMLTESFRETYVKFVAQLDNLRKIIEKPEAYF